MNIHAKEIHEATERKFTYGVLWLCEQFIKFQHKILWCFFHRANKSRVN